jgi:hypothetical protein
MDPDANLKEQRSLAREILARWDDCADDGTLTESQTIALAFKANRLAELVEALDQWITAGGFLPAAWQRSDTFAQQRQGKP